MHLLGASISENIFCVYYVVVRVLLTRPDYISSLLHVVKLHTYIPCIQQKTSSKLDKNKKFSRGWSGEGFLNFVIPGLYLRYSFNMPKNSDTSHSIIFHRFLSLIYQAPDFFCELSWTNVRFPE